MFDSYCLIQALVPPTCPPLFLEIALKCCEYEPKDRYDANQVFCLLSISSSISSLVLISY